MKTHACPACGESVFSYWQKCMLGPARSIACRECGARVSVPWGRFTAWMAVGSIVSFLGGVMAVAWFPPVAPMFVQFVLGVAVLSIPWSWAYDRVVPLVQR
jgi:hypothetical protein